MPTTPPADKKARIKKRTIAMANFSLSI